MDNAAWHPCFGPRRTRLRVRPGMAFLYMALLTLLALRVFGPVQWRILASGLLPLVGLAILIHRKPLAHPLEAIRRGEGVPH